MLEHKPGFHSFFWLNNILLYGYNHILFIPSPADGHLGRSHLLGLVAMLL